MNEKQAREEALDIVISMIYQEIASPTGFTSADDKAKYWNVQLVQQALDDIGDQLFEQLRNSRKSKGA